MPFYAIYKALGRKDIDLFVLDIEGHEMEILHTIPWHRVNILVKTTTVNILKNIPTF